VQRLPIAPRKCGIILETWRRGTSSHQDAARRAAEEFRGTRRQSDRARTLRIRDEATCEKDRERSKVRDRQGRLHINLRQREKKRERGGERRDAHRRRRRRSARSASLFAFAALLNDTTCAFRSRSNNAPEISIPRTPRRGRIPRFPDSRAG